MTSLPQYVYDRAELAPIEDVLLALLRPAFPGVHVTTRIPDTPDGSMFPMILARAHFAGLGTPGDPRFINRQMASVHTFTVDPDDPLQPDGDEQGALLSEAVRVTLRDAGRAKPVLPDLGTILAITMTSPPRRVTDWATATGPVQYADLPSGTWRYETHYRVTYRRPLN